MFDAELILILTITITITVTITITIQNCVEVLAVAVLYMNVWRAAI